MVPEFAIESDAVEPDAVVLEMYWRERRLTEPFLELDDDSISEPY